MANTADLTLYKQSGGRVFYYPTDDYAARVRYAGNITGIEGLTDNAGDLNPIQVPSPTRRGSFIITGVIRGAPDLSELTLWELWERGTRTIASQLRANDCDYTIYVNISDCARPDVFSDWQAVLIAYRSRRENTEWGDFNPQNEDKEVRLSSPLKFISLAEVYPIKLAQKAASTVLAEILDVIYADQQSCGTCTPYSAGCEMKFALAKANPGSVGLSGQCIYTKDGINYGSDDINSLLGQSGTSMQAVGNYLVVTQATGADQHHYALKSNVTDNPNTGNWTAVSTGYQSGGGGLCSTVGDPARLFVGGEGGYIYATDDPTTDVTVIHNADITTENFNAIAVSGPNLIAVGDNATILVSSNVLGDLTAISFSAITAPSSLTGVDLTACWVWNATNFVIAGQGEYWYTVDGGDNWTQTGLPRSDFTEITDIQFSPDMPAVGGMTANSATTGYLLRSIDGGRSWQYTAPAISQISGVTVASYNAVALCGSNAIFTGGLKSGSTDGALGEAT